MPKPSHFKISVTVAFVAVLALLTVFASATEVQLAGVRLGAHYSAVVKAWGQPDSVFWVPPRDDKWNSVDIGAMRTNNNSPASASPGGGMGGPGGPGAMRPGGAGGPGGPGAGGGPGGAMPGMMGAGGGGAPTAAGGSSHSGSGAYGVETANVDWGAVSEVLIFEYETAWFYNRKGISMAFILDRDGYVVAIAVSGEKCNWARTALGEPLRTIKLGDSFKKVVERYGYPQTTNFIEEMENDRFSKDTVLHFEYNQNVVFTLRDMKVRQIYIREAEIRSAGK